jgi:hypothetical protein
MNEQNAAAIKADFAEWSGGFPPESPEQVTVYIDYACPNTADSTLIREILLAWMQQEAAVNQ